MANFNKNMFVGAGGLESINLSHFIGAVYGMENMMGMLSRSRLDVTPRFTNSLANLCVILHL